MIPRKASASILSLSQLFKVVALIGPRQSGKTTLVRHLFPEKTYVSLENLDTRNYASTDPRGFLSQYPEGAIFDEIQQVPELFSYMQQVVDESKKTGLFILTGSNNFLLQEQITQSLAGRVAYLQLLPFSLTELLDAPSDLELMVKGFYPPVYDQGIPFGLWYANYIRTYLEKDVRQIKSITRIDLFQRLLRLLAGRVGQELNYSSLSVELGIDVKTVQSWVGVLESSFIVYRLKPFYKNYNKTIVKRPKLYFHDVGLACALMNISSAEILDLHPSKGALFENMVVMEYLKHFTQTAQEPPLFYWRDKTGREIDLIVEDGTTAKAIEIKIGKTYQNSFSKHLLYWMKMSQNTCSQVLYRGEESYTFSTGVNASNWRQYFLEMTH